MPAPKTAWFNFIYTAGLYDYLADPVALALSERLEAALRPECAFIYSANGTHYGALKDERKADVLERKFSK